MVEVEACAGCMVFQTCMPRSMTNLRSPPSRHCYPFSCPSIVVCQSSLTTCSSTSTRLITALPSIKAWVMKARLEFQTLNAKHVCRFKRTNECGNGQLHNSRCFGRWGNVGKIFASSSQGADEKSKAEGRPDISSTQNPGDKKEIRNGKHEGNVDDHPTTSGRDSPSASPAEQNWWRRTKSRWNLNWSWKGAPAVQAHEIGALLLQLSVVVLLMRLLRPGVPFPGGSSSSTPDSSSAVAYVSVPFSEFLTRINRDDVENVEIDGVHFTFSLRSKIHQAQVQRDPQVKVEDSPVHETHQISKPEVLATAQPAQLTASSKKIFYTTTRPTDITTPYTKMQENGVEFGAPDKRSVKLFNTLSIFLLYLGLIIGLLGRFSLKLPQGKHLHISPAICLRSTGRLRSKKNLLLGGGKDREAGGPIMFADVAGVDEAKEELEEIVEFLKNPERYTRLGARPPRGILLVGPPGTGKTLLAKAVAGEADVPFISCSASEFVELYVGMGASRVRDLFARAKKEAPSIVFIDEIDAVAKGRDGRLRSVGNDEREQTLNQLLTELDGFESNSTVIVLGATNRADVLDPALRRPGRFDRIVMVEPPDRHGREEILTVHVRKKQLPLAPDVNINVIAAATAGFTGADLANLVNEAALLAGRANKLLVGNDEFSKAVERSIAGIEKKRSTLHGSEKAVVARHEAGHAVVGTAVAKFIPDLTRVQKLSILPRTGGTLGFTYIPPAAEDRYLLFIDELRGRLVTLLGGRAAEEVAFSGRVSTGALDDIKRATDLAYKAVAEYGLNTNIGPISLATLSGGGLDEAGGSFSWGKDQGHMADLVQEEVSKLIRSAMAMALLVIRSNPTALEGLGAQLEAEERIDGAPLEQWLNMVVAPVELAAFIRGNT